jgi:NAD(P)-dependent dehydrogenase (short-subunit alcohol dehydrogenase family)
MPPDTDGRWTRPLGPEALDMTGRTVLVTGTARGIGAATEALFLRLGASVAGCDRVPLEGYAETFEEKTAGGGALLRRLLDVRDPDAADRFVAEVTARMGPVDILVNNAGGSFPALFLDVSPKGEAMLIAENFTQASHLIRRCAPGMPEGSAIVNVTSIEGHQGAPGFAVYAAMKAALESLTKSLALELAPRGIRVNTIAPDGLVSPGEAGAREQFLAGPVPYEPAFLPPLGRFGTPDDGAAAIAFLASDLSRYITGTTIHLDGGNRAAAGWRRVYDTPTPEGPGA